MQNNKTYIILLFTFFIIISCNKDEDSSSSYGYYKISESLYPLVFDIGSYWIYEDTDNLLVDSIIIVDLEIGTYVMVSTSGQGATGEEQFFNLTYSSTIFGQYEEQIIGGIISRGLVYGGYIYISGHNVGVEVNNARISAIYDSLVIKNVIYRNVVKMEISQDRYIDSDMNFYYVDSIGVIKKEIFEDDAITETWELLRFDTQLYSIE